MDPNVDEHSVMTYLSQFPKAKLKPGAPLRPKLNPKKARAYGPGEGAGPGMLSGALTFLQDRALSKFGGPWEPSEMW